MLGSGLLLGAATIAVAGRLLVQVDPLPAGPVDAIFVLGGSRVDRWLYAVELYETIGARRIMLSRTGGELGEDVLAARGITVPNETEIARTIMVEQLGVPDSVVQILDEPGDNTAHEAELILNRARRENWRQLVIITARSATRRAGFAFRRTLGNEIDVIVRDVPYDDYEATWWWRDRVSFRQTFYEVPKFLAYLLGLGA